MYRKKNGDNNYKDNHLYQKRMREEKKRGDEPSFLLLIKVEIWT